MFCLFGWVIKTNKKGVSSHFAECNTRERVHLPSAVAKHSAKKAHLGTGKVSLPSVVALALSKEASFVECLLVHSAKELGPLVIPLSSASPTGTRQRGSLCRVPPNPLSKGTGKGAHRELLCRASVQ
jgi:hypothetical protein